MDKNVKEKLQHIEKHLDELKYYDDSYLYETEDPYELGFTEEDKYDPTLDPDWFEKKEK